MITDIPSTELEVTSFTPLMIERLFSSGSVTFFSTSIGLAPGYAVITVSDGISISGIISRGSEKNAIAPRMSTKRKTIATVIGFFTLISDIFIFAFLFRYLNFVTIIDKVGAYIDYFISFFDPLVDYGLVIVL